MPSMGFLRPKSRGKNDEAEPQRRNRLSKPMTNKSQTNLRAAAKQQEISKDGPSSRDQSELEELAKSSTAIGTRARVKSRLFDSDDQFAALPYTETKIVRSGVAQLVAQFETAHPVASASQLTLSSNARSERKSTVSSSQNLPLLNTPQRESFSDNSSNRASLQSTEKGQERGVLANSCTDPFAIPSRRKSNYRPGEATRKPVEPVLTEQASQDVLSKAKFVDDEDDDNYHSALEDAPDDISKSWVARPHATRSDTPRSLERTALGNFSLGSLHVVNGRASPAMSEASKLLSGRASRVRDISSEYADSEYWEDEVAPSETSSTGRKTPTNDIQRTFSYTAGSEQRMVVHSINDLLEDDPVEPKTPTRQTPDRSSILAQEYIAELPASPFAELDSSSPVSSLGSVIRHKGKETDLQSAFRDEGIGHCQEAQSRVVSYGSDHSSVDSKQSVAESKLSSVDSRFARDDAFQSALEFQSNPSREVQSVHNNRLTVTSKQSDKSDSGYSSGNSITSMPLGMKHELPQSDIPEKEPEVFSKESHLQKMGGFPPLKSALKPRDVDSITVMAVETRPTTVHTTPTVESPIMSDPSPTKSEKSKNKLRKIRPISKLFGPKRTQEIVVQRNVSADSYDVPAISAVARANLNLRTQQLPELERTVQTPSKVSNSNASLVPPQQEIRFPTPVPEPEVNERQGRGSRSRSRSRTRSKSRRRSVLEFFIGGDKSENRKSTTRQDDEDFTIDDLGDVVAALGENPYDVAGVSRRRRSTSPDHVPRRPIVPHRLSYQNSRPKSMMDDRTASELARIRSRSIHENDDGFERRSSFNDRGGRPGKLLRASSMAGDAPPLPPMPSEAQLRRLSQRHSKQYSQFSSPESTGKFWTKETSAEPESSPAPPPPPPHSPRPSFIDEPQHGSDEEEDMSLAPIPPCHSPMPMDVCPEPEPEPSSEDPWEPHALTWKARRQSAGEALRAKWHMESQIYHDDRAYEDTQEYYTQDDEAHFTRPTRIHYYEDSEFQPPETRANYQWDDTHEYYGTLPQEQQWDDNHAYIQDNQRQNRYGHERADERYYDDQHYDQSNSAYDQQNAIYTPQYERDARSRSRSRDPIAMASRPLPARPTSQHSHVSHCSHRSGVSLAEELHPEDRSRQQPAPEFGRYSGGLQYSYEGRHMGFGGSAGTRSVSGKADGAWKGTELRKSWGVDLGDVPIMGTAVRAS